jgi:hypothetical protein
MAAAMDDGEAAGAKRDAAINSCDNGDKSSCNDDTTTVWATKRAGVAMVAATRKKMAAAMMAMVRLCQATQQSTKRKPRQRQRG